MLGEEIRHQRVGSRIQELGNLEIGLIDGSDHVKSLEWSRANNAFGKKTGSGINC